MQLSQVPTDKPINLLFHDGTVNIKNDRPDVYEITPSMTVAVAEKLADDDWARLRRHPRFLRDYTLVFPDTAPPEGSLKDAVAAVQHIVGLLLLTQAAVAAGKTPFWRWPEAYLHPKQQLGLGDLLIALTKGNQ